MVYGRTDHFECPECASKQWAKILELVGWRPKRLLCVTCGTEWDPAEQGKDHDHETEITPAVVNAE